MRRHGVRGLVAQRRRVQTTDSRHAFPVAPNLLGRQFTAAAPNQVWLADLTYIPTGEGWLYMAAIMDLHTRKIVGWSLRDHLRAELATSALMMAIQRQRQGLDWFNTPTGASKADSHDRRNTGVRGRLRWRVGGVRIGFCGAS